MWRIGSWGAVWLVLLLGACAGRTVTLKPGEVLFGAENPDPDPGGAEAWSLWVAPVKDARPNADDGAVVGQLFPRFQGQTQIAYLEPEPAVYLHDQLSRFLLHRGLEASEERRAKLLLQVDLTEFSLSEVPGSVWDEISIQVKYTVRFVDRSGEELGYLRLAGARVVKTPGGVAAQAADGFRDSLGDTFPTILDSEVFRKVMQRVL